MENKVERRGGARVGSGRKPMSLNKKRVQLIITIDVKTMSRLRKIAKERDIKIGRFIDELMENYNDEKE